MSSTESSTSDSNKIENIQLTVRCALQSFDDLTITCPVEWKVAQLKAHLFEVCSTKPEPKRQRLIYAGHCLKDTQTLREIVEKASEGFEAGQEVGPQVIHMVCASKEPPHLYSSSSAGLRHRPNATTTNNTNSGAPATVINAAGQQGFLIQNPQILTNAAAVQQYQLPPNATPEQMAYYASYMNYQQALMAWMQYNQFVTAPVNPQFFTTASPLLQAGQYNMQFNLQAGHGFNNPMQQVNQNPQNNNNQAQNVAANEEEHVNDILGILYKAIRVGFFLMVLFFYSSFERFLAVFLIICILWYVHRQREQNNLNAAARRIVQPPVAQPQQPPLQQPQNDGENNNNAEAGDEHQQQQNDNNNNEVPAPPQPPHPQLQSSWNLFCSTVSSFFLSLIPENPVPIDVRE
uniref:Ubiquitin-like domain-containing protein n=1 Tax=Panagrolaimus sp. PS1159 TaxID=55785 RepID=A0AC35F0C3_9BILA